MTKREYFSIIDVDNTLFPLEVALLGAVQERIPEEVAAFTSFVLANKNELSLRKRIDLHKEQLPTLGKIGSNGLLRFAGNTEAFNNTPPYEHAKTFLEKLIQKSEVLWVTARGSPDEPNKFYDNGYNMTLNWANKFSLPYDQIILEHSKANFAKNYKEQTGKKPFLFFDDHEYQIGMASAYVPEFKFAMKKFPYNMDYINKNKKDIIGIDCHTELIDKLQL